MERVSIRMSKIIRIGTLLFKHRWLINKSNVEKAYRYFRNGELIGGVKRIYRKLETFDAKIEKDKKRIFLNDCLYCSNLPMMKEMVDVIIPIYNAYEYTVTCIESVYKNTNTVYNLYLINDCSTDERVKEYLQNLKSQPKPEYLQALKVIEHTDNLGFIRTVNEGFFISENHIVILNTDTEVPQGWLSRLLRPITEDERIASVTPFSNCATICSFPDFCQDNVLPEGVSISELDVLFSKYGSRKIIEIPTGVGFCMAINRKCLQKIGPFDTVFGKGYCEENDWCRRAVNAGFVNVMITNLFVYHKHGASFGEFVTKNKQKRIDENLCLLSKRYPDYLNLIDAFVLHDPARGIRDFMKTLVARHVGQKQQAELLINHSLGGGATVYLNRKIEKEKDKVFFVMELLDDRKSLRLKSYNCKLESDLYFDFAKLDKTFLEKLVTCLHVNKIFVNQLVEYPAKEIIDMISLAGVPYTFFVHDFYCVCPRYNLLNEKYQYCHNEKNIKVCNRCLRSYLLCQNIFEWRNMFSELLNKAECVIAPSDDTANIVGRYYSSVNIKVKEHEIPKHLHYTYNETEHFKNDIFHVSVLGAIGIEKGARIIEELVKIISERHLPIKITIIGYTDKCDVSFKSSDGMFEITGKYDNSEVSNLLAKYRTDIVLIPSIWPETYSYTVSEAIYSGYKVLAFDIGAPAERIRRTKMGWLVAEINANALMSKIIEIINERKLMDAMDNSCN